MTFQRVARAARYALGLLAWSLPRFMFAQQPGALPPVRQLTHQLAIATEGLGRVTGIRALSDGRVMVNDPAKRRLVLLDSTLSIIGVVLDSAGGAAHSYPHAGGAGLLAYLHDTTIFVDPIAVSLLVIDPAGQIVRVVSPPRPAEIGSLVPTNAPPIAGSAIGGGGGWFDARGNLIYGVTGWTVTPSGFNGRSPGIVSARRFLNTDGTPSAATEDSVPIMRASLVTKAADTVAYLAVPIGRRPSPASSRTGGPPPIPPENPVLYVDGWAVVSDGSIAIIHPHDYHIDWINADGSKSSTPAMAHDWRRLSDSAKQALVDSAQLIYDRRAAVTDSMFAARGTVSHATRTVAVPAPDIPDYLPPFMTGAVSADADDNLWVREGWSLADAISRADPVGPPPIYDIINRAGRVVDRVQLPPSLTLAGFGPGVVYLTSRESRGIVVVKYRIR